MEHKIRDKIVNKIRKIIDERGIIGLIFSPFDFTLSQIIKNIFGLKFFTFISAPDVFYRYKLINEYISKKGIILDVGGGNTRIDLFTDNSIICLDVNLSELKHNKRNENILNICGSMNKLPFKRKSIDFVCSAHAIEHIHCYLRKEVFKEFERVAKNKIIINVPSSQEFDKKLLKFRKLLGINDKWLKEHFIHKHPSKKEISRYIKNSRIKYVRNYTLWYWIMILESIPVLNKLLPGIIYFLFKKKDEKGPFVDILAIKNINDF